MSDDVLITPASRKIEFKDSGGTVDAKIETDASGNLTITNPGGDISLGDTTADVIIGDGVNSVDLVMEVNGEIRGTSGVTITLGDSGSNISMGTDLGLNSNDITGTGNVNITGGITVTGNVTASSFYGDGSNLTGITVTGVSAGTSATLQTKINTLSATMATSINNRTAAITSVNTRINSVSALAASVSSTMATSINNRTAAITSVNTRINAVSVLAASVSSTMATSINNRTAAITSVNSRINAVSVLAASVSSTMATSIGNKVSKSGDTMTGVLNLQSNLDMRNDSATAARYVHIPRGGGVTLYGDTSTHHAIMSRNASNSAADDILISSYGGVHIDLDSNNNNSSDANFTIGKHNTFNNLLTFNGETSDLTVSGNVTAYSDKRLKDNIETLDGSKVYDMRGVSFTKEGKAGSGVVAQELQAVAPELVNENGEYLSVAYGNLVGYLIETVKDLNLRIKKIEEKLED